MHLHQFPGLIRKRLSNWKGDQKYGLIFSHTRLVLLHLLDQTHSNMDHVHVFRIKSKRNRSLFYLTLHFIWSYECYSQHYSPFFFSGTTFCCKSDLLLVRVTFCWRKWLIAEWEWLIAQWEWLTADESDVLLEKVTYFWVRVTYCWVRVTCCWVRVTYCWVRVTCCWVESNLLLVRVTFCW